MSINTKKGRFLALVLLIVLMYGAIVVIDVERASAGCNDYAVPGGAVGTARSTTERQKEYIRTIIGVGKSLGVSRKGIEIAIAVADVESIGFYNVANATVPESLKIPHDNLPKNGRVPAENEPHDHPQDFDSVGLFQQRPSWGSVADRMNPVYAAFAFYNGPPLEKGSRGLLNIKGTDRESRSRIGYEHMGFAEAANKVQVSRYPERYAQKQEAARAFYEENVNDAPPVDISRWTKIQGPRVPVSPTESSRAISVGGNPALGGPVMPLADDVGYRIGADLGDTTSGGKLHQGVDFDAPSGTPVRSATDGDVVYAGAHEFFGNMLIVSPEPGTLVIYRSLQAPPALKPGDPVKAGQVIGAIGSDGGTDERKVPHLHFEVREGAAANQTHPTSGNATDPLNYLRTKSGVLGNYATEGPGTGCIPAEGTFPAISTGSGGNKAWGGYPNGNIPAAAMQPMKYMWRNGNPPPGRIAPDRLLRGDAAAAIDRMAAAYKAETGNDLPASTGYRPYEVQVRLKKQKPGLAAVAGTSNHGWGMAVDFALGEASYGHPAYRWMTVNGPRYGWINPPWARQNGSKPEAWHWEFQGVAAPT